MMTGDIHVHVHLPDVSAGLARIEQKLDSIQATEVQQVADLAGITAKVQENGDATASAVSLLNQLSQMIRDNATDQNALNDLANTLDSQADALAAAVVANTPAAPGGGEPAPPDGGGEPAPPDGGEQPAPEGEQPAPSA